MSCIKKHQDDINIVFKNKIVNVNLLPDEVLILFS